MRSVYIYLFSLVLLVTSGFIAREVSGFTVPEGWPQPVYDFTRNPLSDAKVQLGRALFYDPLLSRNGMISCASCHSPFSAFTHVDHALSHGIEDKVGTRNSPALMNLAWQPLFMWDGSINHLDVQALAPISHPLEMDENLKNVVAKLQAGDIYPQLFFHAFGDSVITGEHTLKALSQFMLTLVSAESKYDSVKRGERVFTAQEANGYRLFQLHCNRCHTEPLFSNYQFLNNGLAPDSSLRDGGRIKVTRQAADSLKFKVPTLRNVAFTYPYMHDGRFKKLSQVLSHYTSGIQESPTLDPQLRGGIPLSSNDKADLIAFLNTLTDRRFVFNPAFQYPKEILQGPKD